MAEEERLTRVRRCGFWSLISCFIGYITLDTSLEVLDIIFLIYQMGVFIPALRVSQSCLKTHTKAASGKTCDLGWGCAKATWALCTRPPAVWAPALLLRRALPPSRRSTENVFRGDHIGSGHRTVIFQKCLDSEPPGGATRGSLHPRGSAASALFHPRHRLQAHKTASVPPSMKLNGVHSPSSAPSISKGSQAHYALYSLVLCH